MSKTNYEEFAVELLKLMGGQENIKNLTHCITRLRMNVANRELVQETEIGKLPGAMGCQWSGEQFQVIIGTDVADAYKAFTEVNGMGETDNIKETHKKENENQKEKHKKFSLNSIFDVIAGCVTPIIPILVAGGMLKVILMFMQMAGVTAENPTYYVINFVADSAFYFMPVFIGANAAKKFGANVGLGMLMGALFIHPDFVSAVTEGTALHIFNLPVYSTTYSSTVFPVIITVWVMAPIEKFIASHCPKILRTVLEPLLTVIIMMPLALCLLGPIGSLIGTYISTAVIWLYQTTGFFGLAVFAGIFPLLVVTGMHTGFTPYLINTLVTTGSEPMVLVGMLISNINQAAASFAVGVKSKNTNTKSSAISCASTALIGGVTEPAIFGINLRFKTPLYATMIGNFVAGLIAGIGHVQTYAITGGSGLIGLFTSYFTGGIRNLIWAAISVVIGFAVTFAVTMILFKEEV